MIASGIRLLRSREWAIFALVVAGFGAWAIASYPPLYWEDPYARLAFRHDLLVDRWLPFLQMVIVGLSAITESVVPIRIAVLLFHCGAVALGYLLFLRHFGRGTALTGTLLLCTNSFFLVMSTVPYLEGLFLCAAFGTLLTAEMPGPRWRVAHIGFAWLACLTRYEGWILVGLLVLFGVLQRRKPLTELGVQAALYLLPIVTWVFVKPAFIHSHELGYAANLDMDTLMFITLRHGRLLWNHGGGIIACIGIAGVVLALRRKHHSKLDRTLLLLVLGHFAAVVVFRPYGPTNERPAYLVAMLLSYYAAFAIVRVGEAVAPRWPLSRTQTLRAATSVAVVFVVVRLYGASTAVQDAASQAPYRLPYEAAAQLRDELPAADEDIRIAAPTNVYTAAFAVYTHRDFERIGYLSCDSLKEAVSLPTFQGTLVSFCPGAPMAGPHVASRRLGDESVVFETLEHTPAFRSQSAAGR